MSEFKYPVTKAKTARGVLAAARRVIEKFGWYQGSEQDYATGAVCLYGAIQAVVSGNPENYVETRAALGDVYDDITKIVQKNISAKDPYDVLIAEWNDEVGRTVDEVLAVMRA